MSHVEFDYPHYYIGIGASAGGLEAIHDFFDHIRADTHYSFFLIQHLSPDYKSLMAELLSKHTRMQVVEAIHGAVAMKDVVYVLPSKKIMTIENGAIKLFDKLPYKAPNKAIDIFFHSLARFAGTHAVGIVLSGTGSDGSNGISDIKKAGGTVIVQEPSTAAFDGMPNSAIATGLADLVLRPKEMGEEMVGYLSEIPLVSALQTEINNDGNNFVDEVLSIIKDKVGRDFTLYKRPTIHRRLARRMQEKNICSPEDYLNYLQVDPEETNLLSKDFLIGVTRFFRDPDAFESLRVHCLPEIFSNADLNGQESIKVWVVGCSTGEEAYSIAILFKEYMDAYPVSHVDLKIFATDIDKEALDIAKKAVYAETALKELSHETLEKHFVKEGAYYRVNAAIRKLVVFAEHDVTKSPPFSKLQLLSCRNMLIYMNPALQQQVLKSFHFALNQGGFLFLGPSENEGMLKDSVTEIDKKWKIYELLLKNRISSGVLFDPTEIQSFQVPAFSLKPKNAFTHVAHIFKESLLEEFSYAGILITKEFEIKQATGNFSKYLSFPKEHFNFNLLNLVPRDLSIALGVEVRKAIKTGERVVSERVKVEQNDEVSHVHIIIKPYLDQKEYLQPFLFIILSESLPDTRAPRKGRSDPSFSPYEEGEASPYDDLEKELRETKENLQAVVEEIETANEELQSSNEEILSTNEELQSTNEELQSLNEELHTVNSEHQSKIKELVEANDDLNNYFQNSNIGQIFVDKNLVIRAFSPIAKQQINLVGNDLGRPLNDFSTNFNDGAFIGSVIQVIKSGDNFEKQISLRDGRNFLMKISPYVRQDGSVDGAVINFVDVTEMNRLTAIMAVQNQELRNTSDQLEALNRKLEQSNFELLQFASVASHDLKEPLRKIQSFGNLLTAKGKDNLGEKEKMYLEKIVSSSKRMQTLIEDILSLSKVSQKEVSFASVNLNEVIDQIKEDLEIQISDKGATLTVARLEEIEAMSGQMRQLFQNLIANALKFNEHAPHITVQPCEPDPRLLEKLGITAPEWYACIRVIDDGIGFEPQYKDRIFGMFQRLNSKDSFQGTGIGLTICKKIVENHRGFIDADSQLGQGAVFTLLLPKKQRVSALK